MPTFSYKGYDFEVDHTPTEAEFSQMSAYVDSLPPKQEAPKKRQATWGESLAQGFGQVGNSADLALSTLAGGAAALFGDKDSALSIEEERKARKAVRDTWGSPQETQQSFIQKAANAVNPLSLAASGFSPATTVDTALQAGETSSDAVKAGMVDAAGNVAGMILPGFKQGKLLTRAATGAGANMAQEYVTKKAIQDMLKTEQGKKSFEVTGEDLALAGLAGGAMAGLAGKQKPAKAMSKVDLLREAQKQRAPAAKAPEAVVPEQLRLFDQFEERSPISKYQTEMAPDMWRVDENGIPIRADLSMEVQNLQQPLQRNLFGDELDVNFPRDPNKPLDMATGDIPGVERFSEPVNFRNDPENQRPLTEAIDSMEPAARTAALEQTQMDRELPASNELEVARAQAENTLFNKKDFDSYQKREQENARTFDEGLAQRARGEQIKRAAELADGPQPKGFNKAFRKQRGSVLIDGRQVTIEPTETGFVAKLGKKIVGYLNSNITPEQRAMLGEDASVDMVKVDDNVKGRGVGRALYEAWSTANEGNVIPSGKTSQAAWNTWKKTLPGGVDKFVNQEAQRIHAGADPSMVLGNIPDPEVAQRVQARAAMMKSQGGGIRLEWWEKEDGPHSIMRERILGELYNKLQNIYDETTSTKEALSGTKTQSSAKEAALWRALEKDDFLGFDYPHQAIQAIIEEPGAYDMSPNLKRAVTAYVNEPSPKTPFNFKKQGGGVFLGKRAETLLENSAELGEVGIPKDGDVEAALSKALSEQDGKLLTYSQSGASSAAMKTGSSAIKFASEVVQNAVKRADLAVRETVFPTEKAFRALSKQEMTDLATVFKDEMFSGNKYDGDLLAQHLSVKQLEAYTKMRNLFKTSLEAQNQARTQKGLKPITESEAYMSSRWQGDFRRAVKDAEGKTVWYLAADTQRGLEAQTKALLAEFPELVPDKAHKVSSLTNKTDLESTYTKVLDILGRDDPAVARIKEAVEQQKIAEGELVRGQEKHFKHKTGVRGFVGDRPGMDVGKEAFNMFQQQIQYAKNAYQWSEMQAASEKLAGLLSDEKLQQSQPNNVKYIREYFKNALGLGESTVSKAVSDSLRDGLGVSPHVVDKAVGGMKTFFITQKLAMSAGYTLSNIIQASNTLPYLMNLKEQGYNGSAAKAAVLGVPAGMMMAVSHYIKGTGGEYLDRLPNQFYKDAIKYAETNGVTARSIYDESPIDSGLNPLNPAMKVAGFTMSFPETVVRSVAFMTYAQMLKDSGKFKSSVDMFQKAEELVNVSMVDYRSSERPLAFSKLGTTGNFLNTLQTYPMSFYNQYAYMVGEAAKGRPLGLGTMLVLQYGLAGAMGLPGFEDMDKLYKWIRDDVVDTATWNEMMKSPFFSDPKMWMLENLGQASVYGALSEATNLGMTSRVTAPGMGAMLQSPLGPVTDIAKQVGKLGKAVVAGDDPVKWAEAGLASVPSGLQGLLETAPFMENISHTTDADGNQTAFKTTDLVDRNATTVRTPEDIAKRQLGLRSQDEVLKRDVGYTTASANQSLTRRSSELIDHYYSAIRQGDAEKAQSLAQLYFELTGKTFSETQITNQLMEEAMTDLQQNVKSAKTPRQLLNLARMQKILEKQ